MLRLAIVGLLLAACGGKSKAPAWPKPTVSEHDGGESLAPRSSIAALEDSDDSVLDEPVEKPADKSDKSDKDKPKTDTPITPTPTPTPGRTPDEPITTEDIVIEIDD